MPVHLRDGWRPDRRDVEPFLEQPDARVESIGFGPCAHQHAAATMTRGEQAEQTPRARLEGEARRTNDERNDVALDLLPCKLPEPPHVPPQALPQLWLSRRSGDGGLRRANDGHGKSSGIHLRNNDRGIAVQWSHRNAACRSRRPVVLAGGVAAFAPASGPW